MIVDDLIKDKKDYKVIIDKTEYSFDEEIVVKYRLVKGKEIEQDILDEAIKANAICKYYNMALNYSLKYMKSKQATIDYLLNKEVSKSDALVIANELVNKGIINDNNLAMNFVYGLVKNGNGIMLIKNKLFEKGFYSETIDLAIESIDYEMYYEALKKLYDKTLIKYKKEENTYIKKQKTIKYLMSKGYLMSEINEIID